jgi:RNA polymerase sporulation-specific sigma factor
MSRIEDLIAKAQAGDNTAKETLVVENTGLIWSVARRFLGRGTEADDLYQLGCLGFLKAVEGFDQQFGTQFSTYAVPKISGEIRRFLRDDGAVKISRSIKEKSATIKAARNQLINANGKEPTVQEIAAYTGLAIEDIATAEGAMSCIESMQQETGEDGFSLENVLSDTEPEEVIVEKIALRQGIAQLPEKEATVVKLRYFHGLTQERVAKVLSVSQVQVSRIEKKALSKLKELLK